MRKYRDYQYMMKNSKEHKTALPELRFPEFRDSQEWRILPLSKLGEVISGLTYSPEDVRVSGLLVLRSSNIKDGQIKLDDCVYVTESIKGANLSIPEDILICVRNGSTSLIGKNALIPDGMSLCTHGAFMTVFRANYPAFVFQLFQTDTYQNQVNADLGARINSINNNQLKKYQFAVPIPNEQKKIAECFSSLDDLISAVTDKVEALKEHKKGLMQQLFPAEGSTVPARRFPEFQNTLEWKETTLGKLFKIGNGKDYKHLNIGTIPVYGSGGYMTSVDDYLYDGESVCIGRKGTIDKPMFLTGKFWTVDTLFYTHSFVNCTPKFIYMYFQCINWLKHNEAGGVPSLSKTNIEKIKLFVPIDKKNAEQQKIANCLSSVDNLISAEIDKLDQLKAHKKGLMQRLFPKT